MIRCGPLGTGNVVKLVTNQLWFVHAAALGEGFALGMANGVGLATFCAARSCESVGDSLRRSPRCTVDLRRPLRPERSPLDLCLKDLGLIAELAANVGTDLPLTERAHETPSPTRGEIATEPSVGELHVARRIEDDTGLSFRLDGDWTPPWEVTDE